MTAPVRKKGLILLALCSAALIINIDVTIVNVTLPSLVRQLGASTTQLQWIVDAYSLVFAALILAAGSLSDRLGRKGLLIAGLAVFGAGSLAGALVNTPSALIGARVLMGIGAAGIFPSTLSLIANVFTDRAERAKAIGLWGATTGLGIAAGPIIGGWLLGHYWWGSVFAFMVPVALAIAILIGLTVPTSRDPNAPPIDKIGLGLSTVGMAVLVLSIIQAPNWGWGGIKTLGTLFGGLAVIAAFIFAERAIKRPMLDVRLFKNPRFTAASGSITIAFFSLAGFTFLITQYFQFVKGYSPFGTGVRILPVAIAVAVAAIGGTKLAVKIGNKAVVATGLLSFSAGLLWIGFHDSGSTVYWVLALQMIVSGGGMGLITAPATEAVLGAVPIEKAGVGSAVNDATRLFGATLGVAVIGSIAASLYLRHLGTALPHGLPPAALDAARKSVGGALVVAQHVGGAAGRSITDAAVRAFLKSMSGGLKVAGTATLAGSAMAAALLPSRPKAPQSPAQPQGKEYETNRYQTQESAPVELN